MPTKPLRERVSRADLLAEIADLPPSAFVTTAQAAAYLSTSPAVMMNWRSQRRGPRYHGKNEFIRYRLSNLDLYMSARADEIPEIENFEASKARASV
jgi:Helix-turn-helix domain